MNKRILCIINCCLLIFVFLCVFGNICYRSAVPGKGGADYPQRIAVCVYFAIGIIFSIACICNHPYNSNRLLMITSIYNVALPVLLILVTVLCLIFPNLGQTDLAKLNFFDWVIIIPSVLISGLYFYATFKKD